MKFTRRLLCLTTLICILAVPFTASAKEYDYTKEITFLTKIGVSNVSDSAVSAAATRSEAAILLAQAMNYKKQGVETKQVFLDVPASHDAYDAVYYLRNMGAVSDSADKKFRPDDTVTLNELKKMAVVLLGYEQYAKVKGGYPYGYTVAAQEANLLTKLDNDGIISRGELYSIVYNMLFANVLEVTSVAVDENDNTSLRFKKGDILLADAYELTCHNGQIRATNFASIYGDTASKENMVVIDGKSYFSKADIALSDLGKYVDYYLTKNEEVFAVIERDNTTYTINYGDISPSTTPRNVVYKENDKEKNLAIASNAYYMYNALPLIGVSNSDMIPTYGKLELLDTNNDNKIDVVKIWNYESFYIEKVSGNKFFFAENPYGKTYIQYKDTSKTTTFFDKFMEPLNPDIVKEGMVITVAENSDGIIFIKSDDVFTGALESITSDNKAVINGLEYDYLSSCKLNDNSYGTNLKYYIDINETLVYCESNDQSDYAVLYGVEKPGNFGGIIKVKLYHKGYFDIYECNEKIAYSENGGRTVSRIKCSDLYTKYQTLGRELVKFETRNNKIVSIYYPETTTTTANEDIFVRNLAPDPDKKWNIGNRQVMFNSADYKNNYMWSNSDTHIYLISDNEDDCLYMSMYDFSGGHYPLYTSAPTFANVSGYNMTDTGYLKYIAIELKEGEGASQKITYSDPVALVTDRKTILDTDGTALNVISAYVNDTGLRTVPTIINLSPKNAELTNTIKNNNVTSYATGTVKFADLQPGDIIQYQRDGFSGRITSFALLTRASDISNDVCTNTTGFSANRWDAVITGNIISKNDYSVKLSGSAINHNIYGHTLPVMMDTTVTSTSNFDKVYRYDSKNSKFELITASEIYEGARVWMYLEDKYFQEGSIFVIVE